METLEFTHGVTDRPLRLGRHAINGVTSDHYGTTILLVNGAEVAVKESEEDVLRMLGWLTPTPKPAAEPKKEAAASKPGAEPKKEATATKPAAEPKKEEAAAKK